MWGKIIIPMYRLWLSGLYGLYGLRCPLSSKRPINLISLSLSLSLDGYGTKPKLTLCSRIRKLSSKNTGIFRYNPLSIKAVIPYILLACQNHCHTGVAYGRHKKSVATASRSRWRHSMRQTSSVWGPVFVLYCVLNFVSHRDRYSWRCWTVFHKETLGASCKYLLLR